MTPNLADASPERPIRLGRYDVVGFIRRGGMGAVYEAVDRERGQRVALKTLTQLGADALLRFKTEFRSAADLAHPNLVKLYELSCEGDLWFFTMERIDGVDFVEWVRGEPRRDGAATVTAPSQRSTETLPDIEEKRPPTRATGNEANPSPLRSPDRLRDALAQLVRGVRAVHAAGLLHLDLKPSNVLVDRGGRVVVLDFGLVRAIRGAATAPPHPGLGPITIAGTPEWMAPEQFKGAPIGEATDWYAVGLMLYATLTGIPAFAPAAPSATWYARAHLPPPPPVHIASELPADFSALTMALLHPDPSCRPSGETIASWTSGDGAIRESAARRIARSDLIGREAERTALRSAFRRVVEGGAQVVHLAGPPGVGKTALLESLRADALEQPSAIVLRGRCYERETVPYKAFDGMLDELAAWLVAHPGARVLSRLPAWIGELSRVFPVLARVPAIAELIPESLRGSETTSVLEVRRRAIEAMRELVTTLAEDHPLVLEIDDLQWADADSGAMLARLLDAPAPRGLLLAAAFRPLDATVDAGVLRYLATARALRERGDAELLSLDVRALSTEHAVRLARETLAELAASDDVSSAIAREAEGVPFFVLELARHATLSRALGASAGGRIALEDVLASRVQSLPPEERSLVEILAVANSPIPLSVWFAAAGVEAGALRALWSLRGRELVRSTGVLADDRVEIQHDRMREAVLGYLSTDRTTAHHLALGRALATLVGEREDSPWLFDAVRHLHAAEAALEGDERHRTARLDLVAGRRARRGAAFALAFRSFRDGTRLLADDAWSTDYDLALALHGGAAESAALSAAWRELDEHVAVLKARGRSMLDQLVGWEAQIDGHIARIEYAPAVGAALEALRLLGVELPADPGEAEIGAEMQRAMASLASVGEVGLATLPLAHDAEVAAAMRILTRIGSAAYFAKPALFPVLACRQIVMSVERGLSHATPYALSVYGIVLNALGMLPQAHAWGRVALQLLDRFPDRSLEARTRHVIHDLVCTWTVPLASTLDDLERVEAVGRTTGDIEYAGYAAHAYVHNAFYASRELVPLLEKARAATAFIRRHEQMNALHVHVPFERALVCFTGGAPDRASLTGGGFEEEAALAEAKAAGSRSAQLIVRLLMGMVRLHFGSIEAASACFEEARPFLDGVVSTWHVPMFHQLAALAIHALPPQARGPLVARAESDLAALRALSVHGPANFAHRVALLEAASARAERRLAEARVSVASAIEGARAGGWLHDLGLAHELGARIAEEGGDRGAHAEHAKLARDAYARWGATAKLR